MPPGVRARFHGRARHAVEQVLGVAPVAPNSGALVLPTTIAPAAVSRATWMESPRRHAIPEQRRGLRPGQARGLFELLHAERDALERARLRRARCAPRRCEHRTGRPRGRDGSTTAFEIGLVSSMRSSTASHQLDRRCARGSERLGQLGERLGEQLVDGHGARVVTTRAAVAWLHPPRNGESRSAAVGRAAPTSSSSMNRATVASTNAHASSWRDSAPARARGGCDDEHRDVASGLRTLAHARGAGEEPDLADDTARPDHAQDLVALARRAIDLATCPPRRCRPRRPRHPRGA